MLIIGSRALNGFVRHPRIPKDWDVICTYEEFEKWAKGKKFSFLVPQDGAKKMVGQTENDIFEFEIAWPGSTAEGLLKAMQPSDKIKIETKADSILFPGAYVAGPAVLYTLKMSHRYLKDSPHFLKTRQDILILRNLGARIPGYLNDWLRAREKETYWYKHPNLNQNKDSFFDKNQGIKYEYDHDSIHRAMKHLDKPAYEYYKDDKAQVWCSKELFFSEPEQVRLFGVLEEALVLAIERSQVPFKGKIDPKRSFEMALEKVCTSITSGWFREFAWENYDSVCELFYEHDYFGGNNYVDKFWRAVDIGTVEKT
jgi:hypothetical protein